MSINQNLTEGIPNELMGAIISSPFLAKLELMVANVLLPSKCDTPISVNFPVWCPMTGNGIKEEVLVRFNMLPTIWT